MRKFVSATPALMVLAAVLIALYAAPALVHRYTYAQQNAKIQLARTMLDQEDVLRAIDRATSAIAEIVEPSVVHIETSIDITSDEPASLSSGAGWVYSDQGYIITNAHVVQNAKRVSVEFYDGRVVRGIVVGLDPYTDIAVIGIDPGTMVFPAQRSQQRLPSLGERVFAFGSPFGFKFSMSEGIVSGLGREAAGSNVIGGYTNYIQTDAAVNPGNSGGPIVNTDAQVIGMNVAIATARSIGQSPEESGSDSAGISFAIPLGTIEPIVTQIIKHGEVKRGFLGIRYQQNDIVRVTTASSPGQTYTGILITGTDPQGPGEASGLLAGDVIVSIENSPVINAESLSSLITSSRPGESIRVRVVRDDRLLEFEVTLGKMKDEVLAQRIHQPIMIQMGMLIAPNPDGRVQVQEIWSGLPAANSGFKRGDIIERINGSGYSDYWNFFVQLADAGILTGKSVEFLVSNADNESRRIRMRIF